ncbi:MAG TPA: transcription antitermination factor NusB [Nocardioides sp.]|jgi:N utilization substance protein B|uniref:transcription antitermination factor NusB n=1 Tax=Nocardioides sp. TaxID=35761 RepID=UPI002E37E656|nr:transcription antitermination factor NusB [Nocardioides sp.]HEX3932104.1 transcription antitermination factor NusB [Nocardioides sp.]
MPARSKSRKRALDILYAADVRGQDPVVELDAAIAEGQGPTNPYTETLVRGVSEHRERIDEILSDYAEGWSLDRMPAVDRQALRIGAFELLYAGDVPPPVAVSEAIGLVRDLSTDDSPAFVNGVLGSVLRDRESLKG